MLETLITSVTKAKVLKVKGDGNCGPRAIIQSLLVQGILKNKGQWVLNFIKELIKRTESNVKNFYGLNKPSTLDNFIFQYEALAIKKLRNTSQNFIIGNVNSVTTYKQLEDFNHLFDEDESQISALLNRIASPLNSSTADDSIIYFLSACLRKDAASFIDPELGSLLTLNADLDKLDNSLEIESIILYLKHYNLQLVLFIPETNDADSSVKVYKVSEPELTLDIIYRNFHFDVLLFEERLDTSILNREQFAMLLQSQETTGHVVDKESTKKIQIQKDQEVAKALQIEEIELFVLENKTLDNKDSLFLMNLFFNNLGLTEQLNPKEFITASCLSYNSNIIEQLAILFKCAITKLGYSICFQDEIKEQTQKFFSVFFPSCKQKMINTNPTPRSQHLTVR